MSFTCFPYDLFLNIYIFKYIFWLFFFLLGDKVS